MTKILLVFTGGTIGSTILNGTINTSEKQGFKLLDLFEQIYPDTGQFHFNCIQPVQLLSENLFPSIWETLIKAIEAENIAQYDGIIITHGTDTLAYTAAALGLYFNNIKIPLLLVSSNYPLECSQANGLTNFQCAVEFIRQRKQAGVFVPYKNPGFETLVHIATRLSSCLQLSGDFISVQTKAFLSFKDNSFKLLNALEPKALTSKQLRSIFSKNILMIKPYPGLDYSCFKLDNIDVVIQELYHSGTACSTTDWGEEYDLSNFIEKCNQHKISLYMAPAIKSVDAYESSKTLQKCGAKIIWNMSIEVAYVKLLLAYGNFSDQQAIDQFLADDIAFEHIE